MRLVQSHAAVALARPGRPQKGGGIKRLAFALSVACLFVPASVRAQNAYITNSGDGTVSVIDTTANIVVGSPIPVGKSPNGVAVTPDGSKVYVTNQGGNTVSVIDTATNTVVGSPITVGRQPAGVAVTPDGSTVYVANLIDNTVSVIDTATNTVVGSPISIGNNTGPFGMAVTPDGSKVYVANMSVLGPSRPGTVSVIDTATNTVVGSPITVGQIPVGAAVTPDGSKVYVANSFDNTVSVIDTATNTVVTTIPVGGFLATPRGVAVTPDGSKVYVTDRVSSTVSVIATATNTVVGSPITVGHIPAGVAVTPDGSKVYVANQGSNNVSVIATATDTVVGSPIPVGSSPLAFGKFIQPVVTVIPFSAFTARLTVYPNQSEFSINSNFTLGASSNGINPPTDLVTLQIGSFKTTIPPGSFVNAGVPGYSTFVGVINGVSLTVLIKQVSGNNYIFGVIAKNVSLTIQNPVSVTLTIGNDTGTTSVNAVIINTG
jgi:YVTN family beta-propeller protein